MDKKVVDLPYRPGYIKGKRKKAFYLDEELGRALAHRSVDTGDSQSEIVERALRRELGLVSGGQYAEKANLTLVSRAEAEVDFSIGYLDNLPAVGDWESKWYVVEKDVAVLNCFEGAVWHLQNKEWVRVERSSWKLPTTPRDQLTDTGSDFAETDAS